MNKTLQRIRTALLIISIIEIVGISVLIVFYLIPLFNFDKIFNGVVAIIVCAGVVILNIVFIVYSVYKVAKLRQKSDLKAADLIGTDVQEAYNFGMLGLVVVDENNIVLWTSDLFKERKINILDFNILDWEPKLRDLQSASNESTVKIVFNSRNYDVKYLNDAHLYIFKDITEFEGISKYSTDQATVLGIIMIDNYSDVSASDDDANDIISKIRNEIFEYAHEFGVLLVRYRNDAYFAVCNYASLEKMKQDQFSLLEKVHALTAKEETPPTLSIGFAHDFPDVNKLNEMADSAIDICMSRGGDQVVVSKYGEDLIFYGGKTEALENRNKVKVRVLADSLISTIKNSHNVLVLGHADADMDALGSCLGIYAICQHYNKPCEIVYDPKFVERKAKNAFISSFSREEISRMTVNVKECTNHVKSNTLVVLVDCHRPSMSMAPQLIDKSTKVVVIDHHRRSEEFVEMPVFSYIDPSASSASELITELIHYASANPRIDVNPKFATLMLSGIFLDANFFKAKTTGIRTFEASMILKEFGADNGVADDFLKDEFEEYSLITQIISTLKTPYFGIVYCVADVDENIEPATLAKAANQCLQMKGVNASFVIGKVSDKDFRISCRSDGSFNVQLIAEKMGGGGHFSMAAVALNNYTFEKAENFLLDTLDTYLNDAKSVSIKEE